MHNFGAENVTWDIRRLTPNYYVDWGTGIKANNKPLEMEEHSRAPALTWDPKTNTLVAYAALDRDWPESQAAKSHATDPAEKTRFGTLSCMQSNLRGAIMAP
jgi:hypothetical protein